VMRRIEEWVERSISLAGESLLHTSAVIDGNVIVEEGGRLELHGTVMGDLIMRPGSVVYLSGTVMGSVLNEGGILDMACILSPARASLN
jgi:hypothetical protein